MQKNKTEQNNTTDIPETLEPIIQELKSEPRLKTRVYEIDPRTLIRLTDSGRKNARYMTGDQMRRLTENLAGDGSMTSVPLVYNPARTEGDPEDMPGERIVVSGNHRVEAAVKAGLALVWVMEVTSPLTEAQVVALQLSHNAVTGQDDMNILLEMYDGLDLDLKKYSGLTDDAFKLPEMDLSGLSLPTPDYREVVLMFLPAEADDFQRMLTEIDKRKIRGPGPKTERLLAQYSDFERLFETLCRAKETLRIYNTAVAIRVLCDLAVERLDQLEAESESEKEAEAAQQTEVTQTETPAPLKIKD